MVNVDLHLHTTYSDGALTPDKLVELALKNNLGIIAITDHDCTDGIDEAMLASQGKNLTIIPGIELNTDTDEGEIHILGYFIDYKNKDLQKLLIECRNNRVERAKIMVEKLNDIGINIQWSRVEELAGYGAVGRPHIAKAMLEIKSIATFQEAFDKYIGRNGIAYIERFRLNVYDAIKTILQYEGIPVLAHPGYIKNLHQLLPSLIKSGLKGIEVFYANYDTNTINGLKNIASKYNLIPCGGSDYHGIKTKTEKLPGTLGPPIESVNKLIELTKK
ncbi:MAG: PHP domain-containing protein [SAR202 cluster bacterium]|nr:PHP domain-containing protein [SAR202 cluster bacterium]|tara:strand:+ start:1141 stop:1965 length:825 start_codon:yes stop_codon:yes gene_type:complete